MTRVLFAATDPLPRGATVVLEKQGEGGWEVVREVGCDVGGVSGVVVVDRLADGTGLRVRGKAAGKTGNYSRTFTHSAAP